MTQLCIPPTPTDDDAEALGLSRTEVESGS